MIFRSAFFSRRDGLSEDEFSAHWLKVHGEVASHMPGVRRYLQNHIRERLFEVQPFPSHEVGGISQQWFDDIAAMERCEVSPEYAAVKRDIPNFQGAITILVLEGTPVIDQPVTQDAAKLLLVSRLRDPSVARADVARQQAAAVTEGAGPKPLRFVQNFVVDKAHPLSANVPSGKVPVDAISELWFPDRIGLHDWIESKAGRSVLHGQPALTPLAAYAVEEIRLV